LSPFSADLPDLHSFPTRRSSDLLDQVSLLEHGEVHVGIRHDQGSNPSFESIALPPDDVLAACLPSLQLGRAGMIDIVSLASHPLDRKSTRLNSSHSQISYAVFCL